MQRTTHAPALALNPIAPNTATYAPVPDVYANYAYDAHFRSLAGTIAHSGTAGSQHLNPCAAKPTRYDYERGVTLNMGRTDHETAPPRDYAYEEPGAHSSTSAHPVALYSTCRYIAYNYAPTGLRYYGRRYYNPTLGRWLGRDPIEEKGGLHLYGFVRNNPINRWDYLGMDAPVQMGAFGNAPTKTEHEVDGDGSEWEVIYSDISDVAYGMSEWVEIGRTKISGPMVLIDSDPGRDGSPAVGDSSVPNSVPDAPNKPAPDCAGMKANIEARKNTADQQYAKNYGQSATNSYAQRPDINAVAGAAGTAVGIADALFSGAGYKENALGAIGAVTFAIPYGSAVNDAIDQGLHGTSASYFGALGEVVRQGAVFTGSAWIGTQMIKTPTPLTIIGGATLIVGGVGVDAFNKYQDLKFAEGQQLADALQRQTNQHNFNEGVGKLNADIAQYNRDCAGK
jgi:RHS repeat-associated protein